MKYFTILIFLIWIHFMSDFILQSDSMAKNKSSKLLWLSFHCLIYSIPFFIFCFSFYTTFRSAFIFTFIIGISHFLIDLVTSKVNEKLYKNNKRYWLFVDIGFDQALHLTIIFLAFKYIY